MRHVKVSFENIPGVPYSQSAMLTSPKKDRESAEDYDIRTWREHCTVNKDGQVSVPQMAWKQSIDTAAVKLGLKVPGRGTARYANFFLSGYLCDHDVPLSNGKPLTPQDARMEAVWCDPGGKRGGNKRVLRRYPMFDKYHGTVEFTIIDDLITEAIFEQHFQAAGFIVGIGRFRPEKGGSHGRFKATKFEWGSLKI